MDFKKLIFHHIGISVDKSMLTEKATYSSLFKMYTETQKNTLGIKIQHHAFDEGSTLHEYIRNMPHVAFKVENIEKVIQGETIIMPLYEPFKGYKCAMILLNGMPIEIIETSLPEEKIWNDPDTLKNGILYGND